MTLPRFQKGTGALTAEVLNATMDAVRTVNAQVFTPLDQSSAWRGPFLFQVQDNEALGTSTTRWKYKLRQVYMDENGDPAHASGMMTTKGRDGSFFNAWNAAEFCNTATHVQGIPLADLPGTFELKPITDDTLVWGWVSGGMGKLDTGMMVIFSMQNVIAGACT